MYKVNGHGCSKHGRENDESDSKGGKYVVVDSDANDPGKYNRIVGISSNTCCAIGFSGRPIGCTAISWLCSITAWMCACCTILFSSSDAGISCSADDKDNGPGIAALYPLSSPSRVLYFNNCELGNWENLSCLSDEHTDAWYNSIICGSGNLLTREYLTYLHKSFESWIPFHFFVYPISGKVSLRYILNMLLGNSELHWTLQPWCSWPWDALHIEFRETCLLAYDSAHGALQN